ncbi:MAG: thiamine pyrophosphate-binding protein, partial [Stellaceae bacterium]
MARKEMAVGSVAEAYLTLLAERGVSHLFANAGTDFAPLVEAYAKAARTGAPAPTPILASHENLAASMAHGWAVATGRVPAVMVHVSVGTANALCGIINAARENVPILFSAGRSPLTESGLPGARDVYIHWAQEMFDQAGMLREFVKWDYEMRRRDQIADVVTRALELATTSPAGPVYLSLPREVLGETVEPPTAHRPPPRARPRPPLPAASDVEQLADWIAAARNPLIITGTLGRDPRESELLARLADRFALPVVPFNTRYFALSSLHPMFQGSQPGPLLKDADLVLVWETDVPWYPSQDQPPPGARIVQIGEDPIYARYPMRSFPSDLTIRAASAPLLEALEGALIERKPEVAERHAGLSARSAGLRAGWIAEAERAGTGQVCTNAWMSYCLR